MLNNKKVNPYLKRELPLLLYAITSFTEKVELQFFKGAQKARKNTGPIDLIKGGGKT
jgi:hypothetical protein